MRDLHQSTSLAHARSEKAPDSSEVFPLLRLDGGSMAVFRLGPGQISHAVFHRNLDEIWFVLEGRGQIWRKRCGKEEILSLAPGFCITLPKMTEFQFRAEPGTALAVLGVTMPPWSAEEDAERVKGPWDEERSLSAFPWKF